MRGLASRAVIAALVLAPACSLPLSDSSLGVNAGCESDADCGVSGVCYPLPHGNSCVATKADLAGLLIEVRPAPGASYGAGTSHLIDLANRSVSLQGAQASGFVVPLDLALETLVNISPGQVIADGDFKLRPCTGTDGRSMPAKVELRPVTPFVGLTLSTLSAATEPYDHEAVGYSFSLGIPPGAYDVYVQPLALTDEQKAIDDCTPPPPLFLGRQSITQNAQVAIDMPPPSRLTGSLVVPLDAMLVGWTLDIVEPNDGFVVSSVQTFKEGDPTTPAPDDPLSVAMPIDVRYYWVDSSTSPIIRLRPPEGVAAPRVFWDLAGAAIFGDKNVQLDLGDLDTTPVHIQATVLDDEQRPVLATVTIQSKGLTGEAGLNAAYTVTTETAPDGTFEADLLLGKYRVLARPKADASKALGLADWEIKKDDLCCGKVVSVVDKAQLRGVALAPSGAAMASASIIAEPPLPKPSGFLDQALGLAPVLPDKASAIASASGAFSLGVDPDPGATDFAVDFSLRPLVGSGFPWLVRPRVLVHTTGTDLGTLTTPYPAVLTGTVRDPGGMAIGRAVVRAWLPLTDQDGSRKLSGTVIQIAETEADANGVFTLPLPPSISQ